MAKDDKDPKEKGAKAEAPEAGEAKESKRPKRAPKKAAKRAGISSGQIHIFASFNNTIITITDDQGNTVSWASAGLVGFKGSRKSTPFASRLATERAVKAAQDLGLQEVELYVKGPGPGRESAVRAVQTMGLRVRSISDVTPLPHNGCRPPKRRRM